MEGHRPLTLEPELYWGLEAAAQEMSTDSSRLLRQIVTAFLRRRAAPRNRRPGPGEASVAAHRTGTAPPRLFP